MGTKKEGVDEAPIIAPIVTGAGISRATKGAATRKLEPVIGKDFDLCIGYLVKVEATTSVWEKADADGYKSFKGKAIPRISFVFQGVPDDKGEGGIYIQSFNAVPLKQDKWKYDQISGYGKSFMDVFVNELPMEVADKAWDAYEHMLALPIDGVTDVDVLLGLYDTFFKNLAKVFNGGEVTIGETVHTLPVITLDPLGDPIPVWIKLLLYVGSRTVNQGNFGMPIFPGDGVIEVYRPGIEPTIKVNIAKGESIKPRETVAGPSSGPSNVPPASKGANPNVGGTPDFLKH